MLLAAIDPRLLWTCGASCGALLGIGAVRAADRLPPRYGITHLASGAKRSRRNVVLIIASVACGLGITHVLTAAASQLSVHHAALLFAINAIASASVLAAAAIDLEHMILPNELTLGIAALCVLSSPLRAIGIVGSVAGAIAGFAVAYVPFVLYKRIRGQSGMGLGDAKLAIMAGAWHGMEGAVLVLFLGALQSAVAAVLMRIFGITFAVPESVRAEIEALRARAEAGDAEAESELADDPMAAEQKAGTLGMRLPLGPFLALACLEVLFSRRWLVDAIFGWLTR